MKIPQNALAMLRANLPAVTDAYLLEWEKKFWREGSIPANRLVRAEMQARGLNAPQRKRNPTPAQGHGYVPMLNPIRARHKGAIKRVGVTRKAYKARPSQLAGRAPGGRLMARRSNAPVPGYFPNPRRKNPDGSSMAHFFDYATLRDLDKWLDAQMSGDTYRAKVRAKMLAFAENDPEYWSAQSWWGLFDRSGADRIPRDNPKKRASVTPLIHAHHVLIPLQGGRVGVGAGFKTQDAAMQRAEDMANASGVAHRVASRAWIRSHLKAA